VHLYLVYTNLFKVDSEASYFTLYLSLLKPSFRWYPSHFLTKFESGEKPDQSYMLNAKQGSIGYHFYNILGMTRSGIELMTLKACITFILIKKHNRSVPVNFVYTLCLTIFLNNL